MSERKRYVFPTKEIPHLFAHSSEQQGLARNPQNNLYFTGPILYSYRDSFPIARKVTNKKGDRAVLITLDTYSNTTAGHISAARRALSHCVCFTVARIQDDKDAGLNATDYGERIQALELKTARSRSNAEYNKTELDRLLAEANHYCSFFGLRNRFKLNDASSIGELVRIQSEKARKDNALKEAKRKRDHARAIAEAQKELKSWIAGETPYFPHIIPDVYLRIVGDEVQTSLGAVIPVKHARLGLAIVRRAVATNTEYVRNGHTIHLGPYAIDRIGVDGTLTAGCHTIRYAEIERLGVLLEAIGGPCELAILPTIGEV